MLGTALSFFYLSPFKATVACLIPHSIELPCKTSFCLFLYFFVVCFRRLSIILPPMRLILVFIVLAVFCYFATSCVPSLTPSQCTVAALSNDFTDEVSTIKFVAARSSPLKRISCYYSSHLWRCGSRQES